MAAAIVGAIDQHIANTGLPKCLSEEKLNPDGSFVILERWPASEGQPMWTNENRAVCNHLCYPSDLTDDEWKLVEPLIRPGNRGGIHSAPTPLGRAASVSGGRKPRVATGSRARQVDQRTAPAAAAGAGRAGASETFAEQARIETGPGQAAEGAPVPKKMPAAPERCRRPWPRRHRPR